MSNLIDLFRIEQDLKRAKQAGRWTDVINLYNRIIQYKTRYSSRLGLAQTHVELANIYLQQQKLAEAVSLYKQAFKIAQGTPNTEFLNNLSLKIVEIGLKLQ